MLRGCVRVCRRPSTASCRPQAVVRGLPTDNFTTLETDGDATKEHFWEWRHDSPEDLRRRPVSVVSGTLTHAAELTDWLEHHGVDTSGWGQGEVKSVDDLFCEIEAEESSL